MAEGSMKMASVIDDQTARLTDDILVDIISRVPYKSTCCCKCVSTRWGDLISHPYDRKKMPQPLIGFFHESSDESSDASACCFTHVSGKGDPLVDPSLSFLAEFRLLGIVDGCNGLLLCSFCKQDDPMEWDYVVCNPATEKWVVVPGTEWTSNVEARLAFDPAVSSHLYVCELVEDRLWSNKDYFDSNDSIAAVVIYSSKTGYWSYEDGAWSGYEIGTPPLWKSVFFRGVLYLCAFGYRLVALDVEENNWKAMPLPRPESRGDLSYDIYLSQGELHVAHQGDPSYDIYLSQGELHFAHQGDSELSIWVLEDPRSVYWTLKHNVSHLQMLGAEHLAYAAGYRVLSIHPEHNLIFLVCHYEETLMSYDMDSRELRILCQLGQDCKIQRSKTNYLPYVPLYSELLADGQ